jgi:glycosyltransferase involved in cell wall biosynthesis
MDRKPRDHGQKVNLLILTTGLHMGGAEVVVRDLAQTIDRERFNVSICCLRAFGSIGQGLAESGVDIFTLPGVYPGRVDYFTSVKLRRVIRDRRIDVVHSHTTHALVDGILCKLATPGLKVIHTFHFGNYPHTSSRILQMERLCSRFADRLVAVGEFQREQIKSVFHLRDGAVGTVLNGVLMPVPGAGDPAFRSRINADGKILVGTIATLIEQKGLRDLLSAARRVRESRDDVRFVLVGDGPKRTELEQLRRDLELDDTVVFYGWLRDAAALALPSLDIYFQPSLWEAMSISILEAMAAGKAIVATDVGETPRVIEDRAEGLLFRPGDVNGMADAILALAADQGSRRRLGDAASKKVAERFTVDHMTRAYEKVYLDVLQPGRRPVTHADS